jgi:hypothetical protein
MFIHEILDDEEAAAQLRSRLDAFAVFGPDTFGA